MYASVCNRPFSPVLRKADLPAATPVPWWGGKVIRYEISGRCAEPPAWKSALIIVGALSRRWAITGDSTTRTVWFEIGCP